MSEQEPSETLSSNLPEPVARQEEGHRGWLAAINPQNAARIAKGIGQIVGRASKLSNTLSQTVRENRARDRITAAVAERIAAGIMDADPQFERAFERETNRLLREQSNLDEIAEIATEELGTKTEKDFQPGDLDDDWLYQFEEAAKGFSSERMKHTFARILAGEILKPGSFSPATLRALVTMSAEDARLMLTFTSMAYTSPMGIQPILLTAGRPPGNNGLQEFGLSFAQLSALQECGFLNNELSTFRTTKEIAMTHIPASIGNKFVRFVPVGSPDQQRDMTLNGLLPTKVGTELAEVIERRTPPTDYLNALVTHFESAHKLRLLFSAD